MSKKKKLKQIAKENRKRKLTYWEKRNIEKLSALESLTYKNIKRIEKAIDRAIANIEYEIKDLYINYAEKNKMSYAQSLIYLTNNQRKEFQMGLNEYIKKAKDTANHSKYYKDLYSVSTRVRVSRLEALKANIKKEVAKVEEEMLSQEMFTELYTEASQYNQYSLEQFTGVKLIFDKPNKNIIKELMLNPWSGKNYSQKVWGHTDKLKDNIEEVLTRGLIQGKSVPNMVKELHYKIYGNTETKKTVSDVKRLVRTEGAYIIEQATAHMYNELGVEEYEISATLDLKTSEKCRELDMKKFKFKDMTVGVNYPPFHANCRTSTVPVSKFDDIPRQRIAKDKNGKTIYINKMSYEEWKRKYID